MLVCVVGPEAEARGFDVREELNTENEKRMCNDRSCCSVWVGILRFHSTFMGKSNDSC